MRSSPRATAVAPLSGSAQLVASLLLYIRPWSFTRPLDTASSLNQTLCSPPGTTLESLSPVCQSVDVRGLERGLDSTQQCPRVALNFERGTASFTRPVLIRAIGSTFTSRQFKTAFC